MARKKGLTADYQGATPEQVAAAMLKHRPGANRSCEASSVPLPQGSDDRAVIESACNRGRQLLETDGSDTS